MKHRAWPRSIYQSTALIAVAILLLFVFVTVAYFFLVPASISPQQSALAAELATSRAKWEANKPKSFHYVVERHCACPERYVTPYIATEESGEKTASYSVTTQARLEQSAAGPENPEWIDDLFGRVEQAIHADDELQVSYDPRFGYPFAINVLTPGAAQERGVTIYVRDWEVLNYE